MLWGNKRKNYYDDKIISLNGKKNLIKFNKVCHHNAENLYTLIASHFFLIIFKLLYQCELIIFKL